MTAPPPSRSNTTPHTQVPNLLQDFIKPLLGDAERACIDYIVRRTYGFAAPGGGRKLRDRISLSQFEHGIQSGKHVMDLGTGLSRPSIMKALRRLEDKQLIEVTWSCSLCLWQQTSEQVEQPAKAVHCPRCAKTCDREFQLAPLSAKKIIAFLNTHDKKQRSWAFDAEVRRFYPTSEPSDQPVVEEVDVEQYGVKLWHRDLVDRAITELNATRKSPVPPGMVVRHFYKPVLELQTMSEADPSALKRALEKTIYDYRAHLKSRSGKPPYESWHRLARAIVSSDQGLRENMRRLQQEPADDAERADRTARDLLGRAAALNEDNEFEAAREVLSEILGLSDKLAARFADSVELTDAHLKLAFKLGETDYAAAREAVSPYDHMPEWDWPEHLDQS